MFGLFDNHVTGIIMFARIKTAHVISVMAKVVQNDFFLRNKFQKFLIEAYFAEN